ncbi:J domain-containing protein [Prosthecomicrobium sp. N25]|uniref:J domain-containing protein n=1 Tax=Prosthecomicrobium sp. N25 TaxID=3129254 RepID=UPI0030774A2C
MENSQFLDYYEILEISPNANSGSIERMFRYLAQRYHPDNPESGDRLRFDMIMEAHDTLRDPAKRARFDLLRKDHLGTRAEIAQEASSSRGIEQDNLIQRQLLMLLYAKRRRNTKDPGLGEIELEVLLGCPTELLDFHLWYLKEKGWIRRNENGTLSITVDGVDRISADHSRAAEQLLLERAGRTL